MTFSLGPKWLEWWTVLPTGSYVKNECRKKWHWKKWHRKKWRQKKMAHGKYGTDSMILLGKNGTFLFDIKKIAIRYIQQNYEL